MIIAHRLLWAGLLAALLCPNAFAQMQPASNWPLPPSQAEQRFATERFIIREVNGAGGGVTGASRLTIDYPGGASLKVKWKPVPTKTMDGWNNSPRKEMAAYAIQRWLFDEKDYVVPTLAPYCISLENYRPIDPNPKPNIQGSQCVLGIVAVWLEEVTAPVHIYNSIRFEKDAAYANAMADLNLFTYLVDHRDGRRGNLLLSSIPSNPRVFAVDNGIAFEPFPWNFLIRNWYRIRVPWLGSKSVARLRKVNAGMLESLGVVAQMEIDDNGIFQLAPNGPNFDAKKGARVRKEKVQFGLTKEEIEELGERIADLLEKIDDGEIVVR